VLSLDYDDEGEYVMASASDETIQIYHVKEGRHDKSLVSKKYGVKLAKFTHTNSSIIYASTKQNGGPSVTVEQKPQSVLTIVPKMPFDISPRTTIPSSDTLMVTRGL
jgi:COMPASS component SWD2